MRPSGLPPIERYPHGTRGRYVAGCRCDDCRRANREYARERTKAKAAGDWNGLVDATPAREHLFALSAKGVGYKSVAAACDVASSVLSKIRSGERTRIWARTLKRILEVTEDAIADRALVNARPTWKLVRELLRAGLTRGEVAQRLGCQRAALQIGKVRIEARTALAVRRLHAEVMRELQVEREIGTICPDCGFSHAQERRRQLLWRLLPCTTDDVRQAYPCIYASGTRDAQDRLVSRDLHALGARRGASGVWAVELRQEVAA